MLRKFPVKVEFEADGEMPNILRFLASQCYRMSQERISRETHFLCALMRSERDKYETV